MYNASGTRFTEHLKPKIVVSMDLAKILDSRCSVKRTLGFLDEMNSRYSGNTHETGRCKKCCLSTYSSALSQIDTGTFMSHFSRVKKMKKQ